MPTRKKFSLKERIKSFSYARDGFKALLRTEHNAYIHVVLAVASLALGLTLGITRLELMLLIVVIALVLVAEIINTAIEKTMDFISTEIHPQIKRVKDLAAAAVLLAAVAAVVVGCLIFVPRLLQWL